MTIGMVIISCFAIVGLTIFAVYTAECIFATKKKEIERLQYEKEKELEYQEQELNASVETAKVAMGNEGMAIRIGNMEVEKLHYHVKDSHPKYTDKEVYAYLEGYKNGVKDAKEKAMSIVKVNTYSKL